MHKLIQASIIAAIGVLIFASLLVPVVNDGVAQNQTTFNNAPSGSATFKLDGNDDYNLTTSPSVNAWYINGETVNMYSVGGSIVITDKCRFDKNGGYFALYDDTGARIVNMSAGTNKAILDYTASTKTFTVTTYNGYGDEAEQTNEYTYSVENILYFIPGGDYCAIETSGNPDITYYVTDLSQVIAGGAYTSGALDTSYFAEGLTVYVGNSNYTATATAISANVDGINGVIKGSSYAVSVTDGVNTEDFTPYTVFVPQSVKGTTDTQENINDMLEILPLVLIAVLVIGFVGAVVYSRIE